MNVYDLLNINNVDIEQEIKNSIYEVREELKGLHTDLTCRIYSSHITNALRRRHILNRIVDTSDFDCIYSHQFNLVPKDEKTYFLIDLTYEQFHSPFYEELKKKRVYGC